MSTLCFFFHICTMLAAAAAAHLDAERHCICRIMERQREAVAISAHLQNEPPGTQHHSSRSSEALHLTDLLWLCCCQDMAVLACRWIEVNAHMRMCMEAHSSCCFDACIPRVRHAPPARLAARCCAAPLPRPSPLCPTPRAACCPPHQSPPEHIQERQHRI